MSYDVLIERYGDKKKLASEGTKDALAIAQAKKVAALPSTPNAKKNPDTIVLEPEVQVTNGIR
jgi:hypothetical protein